MNVQKYTKSQQQFNLLSFLGLVYLQVKITINHTITYSMKAIADKQQVWCGCHAKNITSHQISEHKRIILYESHSHASSATSLSWLRNYIELICLFIPITFSTVEINFIYSLTARQLQTKTPEKIVLQLQTLLNPQQWRKYTVALNKQTT